MVTVHYIWIFTEQDDEFICLEGRWVVSWEKEVTLSLPGVAKVKIQQKFQINFLFVKG